MIARFNYIISCLFLFFTLNLSGQDSLNIDNGPFKVSVISSAIDETLKAVQLGKSKIESSGNPIQIQNDYDTLISQNKPLVLDTSPDSWRLLSVIQLETKISKWNKYHESIRSIAEKLSSVINEYEQFSDALKKYKLRWELTLSENEESESVEIINDRVRSIVDQLGNENDVLAKNYEFTIILLDSITNESLFISDQLTKLKSVREEKKGNVFVRDSPSFSDLIKESNDSTSLLTQMSESYVQAKKENLAFFQKNEIRMYFHLLIFLMAIALFYFIKNQLVNENVEENRSLSFLNKCLRYPPLLAFIFVLTLTYWYYPDRPRLLMEQLLMILILPSVLILYPILNKDFRQAVLMIGVLYLFEQLRQLSIGQELAQRWMLLFEAIIAFLYSIYLARPSSEVYHKQSSISIINKFFPIVPIALLIAIYSNYTGGVHLSKIITTTIVTGSVVGVVLFMFVSVIEGFIEFLLIGSARKYIRIFDLHGGVIRKWTILILRIWATYTWLMVILRLIQIQESFLDWWDVLLSSGWQFGEIQLTLDLVLQFLFIIVVFSILANVLRALLETELLPRFNLKKGIPMAIGVITRYTVLVLGFFMAVAAAGISLDKLGFLAGALGVGIGFGLQNVVGNFVSGLILIFERPIHIDDVIEADNIEGVVKEVGIRASKIRTWDGAEVVVPNMDLISKQVTNWTLSDTKRRREQILKLEHGTDPNKVMKVIKEVLSKNDEVLNEPAPLVLFLGYREYSLDFRVLYWLSGNLLIAGSDIALSIHNALKRNHLDLAIPKQRMIMQNDEKKKERSSLIKKNRQAPSLDEEDEPADKS